MKRSLSPGFFGWMLPVVALCLAATAHAEEKRETCPKLDKRPYVQMKKDHPRNQNVAELDQQAAKAGHSTKAVVAFFELRPGELAEIEAQQLDSRIEKRLNRDTEDKVTMKEVSRLSDVLLGV